MFLEAEGDIGIVDFNVKLLGIGSLSTHDDSECNFILKSKHQCLSYLKKILPQQFRDMFINKLLNNPGLYLTCSNTGNINKYVSFSEYIDKNA